MARYHGVETRYKGVQFKSRLEARWAVFFDKLGLRWEYEPELFQLPSGGYLPDFALTWPNGNYRLWAEVKPTEDVLTARDHARYAEVATNRILLLLVGLPTSRPVRKANALNEDGGILLLPDRPQFVMTADGAPFDTTATEQAASFARALKFIKRRGS
jgi:hypothetical protein